MFQWSWDSIAAECTDFLGPNGVWANISVQSDLLKHMHSRSDIGYRFVQGAQCLLGQIEISNSRYFTQPLQPKNTCKGRNGGLTISPYLTSSPQSAVTEIHSSGW
jgi:hypothetical protein